MAEKHTVVFVGGTLDGKTGDIEFASGGNTYRVRVSPHHASYFGRGGFTRERPSTQKQ